MTKRFPLLVLGLAVLVGCVTAEIAVQEDGSADLTVTYPAGKQVNEAQVKKTLTAPGVTIESVKITERTAEEAEAAQDVPKDPPPGKAKPRPWPKTVTAKLRVERVEQIETIPFMTLFKLDVETSTAEDGRKTIKAALKNPSPAASHPATSPNAITIRVPGEIAETTAAKESGAVVWKFPTSDYFTKPEIGVTVTYTTTAKKDAGTGKDAGAGKDAGTAKDAGTGES